MVNKELKNKRYKIRKEDCYLFSSVLDHFSVLLYYLLYHLSLYEKMRII